MEILGFWLGQVIVFYLFLYFNGYWKEENALTKMNDITIAFYILSGIAVVFVVISLLGLVFGIISDKIDDLSDYCKLLSRKFNRFIQKQVNKLFKHS